MKAWIVLLKKLKKYYAQYFVRLVFCLVNSGIKYEMLEFLRSGGSNVFISAFMRVSEGLYILDISINSQGIISQDSFLQKGKIVCL